MMEVSKIHLSSSEMELMQNAEIILTKNSILKKIKNLLEGIQQNQIDFIKEHEIENEIFTVLPKISRGENYSGLPYLILDYPRQSTANHFFFIRIMFWWANFFSCTLHLAKNTKEYFSDDIKQSYEKLNNYFIGVNHDPWIHHLGETNYRSISSFSKKEFEKCCEKHNHIKIAATYSLSEWTQASSSLFENWKMFLKITGLIS